MNPLQRLYEFYSTIENELKQDLTALSISFHPWKSENFLDIEENIDNFQKYLNSTDLSSEEIVQRTLFIIKLISFSIRGRQTKEEWNLSIDRNLDMRNRLSENEKEIGRAHV